MTRSTLGAAAGCGLAYALAFWLAWRATPMPFEAMAWSAVLAVLLVSLTVIDLNSQRLPNVGTLSLAAIGLLVTARLDSNRLGPNIIAALVAYGAIVAANALYSALKGKDGIGGGDAKLLMAAGTWTGPAGALSTLLVSTLAALTAVAGFALLRRGQINRETRIPFGPFLCLALWTTWLFGPLT